MAGFVDRVACALNGKQGWRPGRRRDETRQSPSDRPATATFGSNSLLAGLVAAVRLVMTKLRSPGSFSRSRWSGPPSAFALSTPTNLHC
jgi:hypothetical protein